MSFQEKSAWACLIGITVVFTPYFVVVLRQPLALGLLIPAVVFLAGLLAVFHGAIALMSRSIMKHGREPRLDELDRLIEWRAAKWSGLVLAIAVVGWYLMALVGATMVGVADATAAASAGIPIAQALLATHGLFAGFVLSNLVYYGSIIIGYRRMLHG